MSEPDELRGARERERALESALREVESAASERAGLDRRRALIAAELAETRRRLHGKRELPLLPRVRMAGPCPEEWAGMTGDDRVRHCDRCDKAVYNLSAMTSAEVEALLRAKADAGMCARYYERADGMIMTSDCPSGHFRHWLEATIATFVAATIGIAVWHHFGATVHSGRIRVEAPPPEPEEPR